MKLKHTLFITTLAAMFALSASAQENKTTATPVPDGVTGATTHHPNTDSEQGPRGMRPDGPHGPEGPQGGFGPQGQGPQGGFGPEGQGPQGHQGGFGPEGPQGDFDPDMEENHPLNPIYAANSEYQDFEKFRFGGYGEMVANFKNYGWTRFSGQTTGSDKDHRNNISIPRFVLAFDYKFTPKWILGAEIEFEAGGVGTETELEASENGEYETEMEKGGEVALEQFHLTRIIVPQFNIRVGHMIVPVGLTNSHHEPILFFGSERPEGETTILPSTWHETGVAIFGTFGKKHATFDYQAMAVAGLNPDGFGRDNWVADGKQGLFEVDNFSCPAYVARLDYTGVSGLRIGASGYYCPNTGRNADKDYKYASCGGTSLYIVSGDIQYINRYITLRGNAIYGNLENSDKISSVYLSNKSNYHSGAMRQVAKTAITYGGEIGVNLRTVFNKEKCPTIYPFIRYEYFNPMQSVEAGSSIDKRVQESKWQAGLDYYVLPYLVIKADYSNRRIGTQKVFGYNGTYNRENEFSFGIAYTGWFFKDRFKTNRRSHRPMK